MWLKAIDRRSLEIEFNKVVEYLPLWKETIDFYFSFKDLEGNKLEVEDL